MSFVDKHKLARYAFTHNEE